MINVPKHNEDMRNQLNIPADAVVFGGYGGSDSFSIPFVHHVVYEIAKNNPNIYFLFANFHRFCPYLPNIIHLPMITDLHEKAKFINTTDAMLWARTYGETFGIAIGEFSSLNKPVICMNIGYPAHIQLLGEKAILYHGPDDLHDILLHFNPEVERTKDWNAYRDYTPEKVMQIFKKVYLE
jgi:glycosyltransferase involved in cell wall biosynthesis